MPILQTVLLTAGNDTLQLAATNLQIAVDTAIVIKTQKQGSTAVNCGHLAALVRGMAPNAGITLALSEKAENERLIVSSGTRRYQLATMPASDFPKLQEPPAAAARVTLRASQLSRLIARVEHASDPDPARALHSVRLTVAPDKLTVLAICNHRVCEHHQPPEVPPGQIETSIVIPRQFAGAIRTVAETLDANESLGLCGDEQHIYVETDDALVSSLIPAEKFDNWDLLMERARDGALPVARVPCVDISAALKAVTAVRTAAPVTLSISAGDQTLHLSIADTEGYDATDAVQVSQVARDCTGACEATYLADTLKALDADFLLSEVPEMSLLFETADTFALIMARRA